MYRYLYFVFFVFTYQMISINGLKILGIFPQTYKSHINYNNAIMSTLAAAGHNVTMISPFPECSKENYTHIDTSKQSSILVDVFSVDDLPNTDPSLSVLFFLQDEERWVRSFMELKEIQNALNSNEKPFDVIFLEMLTMYPCFTALARKWKIPVIGTITYFQWNYADFAINNPRNPAYVPDDMVSNYFYETFPGRLSCVYNYLVRLFLWNYKVKPARAKFFEEYSHELGSHLKYDEVEPSLIFYNGHSSILSRPMNPNAIDVGGIHIKKSKPLPQKIQKFIDESKHGVILFTLGSMIKSSTFDPETKKALLEAFALVPQRIIWKFEEKLQNVPENVLLVKWLPQRDILAHNKTVAFISHCGISGTYEAIYEAVPVIAIPVFIDQHSNSEIITRNGAGLILNKNTLTKEVVLNALNAVINDTKYAENMKQLSLRFRDRPLSPQETVVYWTEYVHRHNGASHLKTAAGELYWFQYLLLDVLAFVIVIIMITLFALKFLIKCLINACKYSKNECTISTVKKSKKNN